MKFFTLLTLLFFACNSFTQSTFKITGLISDIEKPVPFATVLIKSTIDSSVTKYGFSDTLGAFLITGLSNGNYFVEASAVGYETYLSKVISIHNSDLALGKINIKPDANLETIEVLQLRPIIEVHPDKTVLNVDNTINATGTNGFELLRKAPGVIIDNNNGIILEGKSGVQIHIDNKLSILAGDDLVNFLKSLQATDIDNIEIITQPSAKYDAAGNAGIINIILKRDKTLGTNGTITLGYGYGKNHSTNSSVSLNHRNLKTNVYGSYSNSFGKRYNFINFERNQFGYIYDSKTNNNSNSGTHNGKVGVDWFLNKKHTFGALFTGNYFDATQEGLTTTIISPVSENPEQVLLANNINDGRNYQYAGNLNYRFADTLGHELTIDGDYGIYNRDETRYQPNLYLNGAQTDTLFENNYRMYTPTNIQIITIKTDYSQNLWGGKVGVGGKYSYVKTDNTFDFYDVNPENDVLNEDRSNLFKYTENVNAFYLNYGRKLNPKWGLQLGLRGEQTNSIGDLTSSQNSDDDLVERHYFNIFPSGGLTYTPKREHSFALSFGRRIQRPNYQTLNPFESQIDELSFMKGNPFLQPQYSYNTRLSHTFKYRFNTSLSHSYTSGFFAQITDTIGIDKSFLISRNVADQSTINFGMSLPIQIKKWWSIFFNINTYYTSYIGNDDKFQSINQFSGSFYGQSSFLLPKGLKFEISGWFSSPSVWGGTYLTKSLGSLDAAIEKKFYKDKMTFRAAFSDLFYTSPWRGDTQYGDVTIIATGGWESRRVQLSLSYNFGNNEVKATRKRNTGLEEEDKRTGGN